MAGVVPAALSAPLDWHPGNGFRAKRKTAILCQVRAGAMFRTSIRQKIVGIAAGLIVLAVVTSMMSIVLAFRVGHLLDELTNRYVPAYGDLARANIRSLERALALRRMVIAKMQDPPDEAAYAANLKVFKDIDPEIDQQAQAARQLVDAIIDDASTPSDNAALGRIDDRIDT